MSNTLTLALIQSNLFWEHPDRNKQHLSKTIESIDEPVDLIVLPEMFTSGFTMNAMTVAEPMNGQSVQWLKRLAKEKNAAISIMSMPYIFLTHIWYGIRFMQGFLLTRKLSSQLKDVTRRESMSR